MATLTDSKVSHGVHSLSAVFGVLCPSSALDHARRRSKFRLDSLFTETLDLRTLRCYERTKIE